MTMLSQNFGEIDELKIYDLHGKEYLIPSYQRGYRWTRDNVIALLDDLKEFSNDALHWKRLPQSERKGFLPKYCMQPIVLQETNVGLRVVDGQQRLTTITLILYVLSGKKLEEIYWDLRYEEFNETLKGLLKKDIDPEKGSINWYFIKEVISAIEDWQKMNAEASYGIYELLSSKCADDACGYVFFLKYFIPQSLSVNDTTGQETFNDLNAGQTPLTSSELVKAMFMVEDGRLPPDEQYAIAKEWESIEAALQDKLFCSVWNISEFAGCSTHMDIILYLVTSANSVEENVDRLYIYHSVENWLKINYKDSTGVGLRQLWEKVLRCFWWMQSCYEDIELHNMLGWLAWKTDDRIGTLYKLWIAEDKANSDIHKFKQEIKKHIKGKFVNRSHLLTDYHYDSTSDGVPYILSLVNVLKANSEKNLLRFDLINEKKRCENSLWTWQVEHIDSQSINKLEDVNQLKFYLKVSEGELDGEDAEQYKLKFPDGTEYDLLGRLNWIAERFLPKDELKRIQNKHYIGNLTLLDSHTNESYGNAIFPAKRRVIDKLVSSLETTGIPILPCTAMAFFKTASSHASQMRYWSIDDAESYVKMQQCLLDKFWNEK